MHDADQKVHDVDKASSDDLAYKQVLIPIQDNQRINVMDILRGFALIGIIFMNIEWFNRPISDLMEFDFSQTGIDWGASWLIKVFIEGKFYKIFSILFGMGFAVMLFCAQDKGRPFSAWFVRRMLVLFVLGMGHLVFLWGGDILHDYAVGGLLLLGWILLVRTKRMSRFNNNTAFLKFGLTILAMPILASICAGIYFGATQPESKMIENWEQSQAVTTLTDELEQASIVALSANKNGDDVALLSNDTKNEDDVDEDEEIDTEAMTPEELVIYKSEERLKERIKRESKIKEEKNAFTQSTYWEATQYRAKKSIDTLKFTPVMAVVVAFPLFLIGYWFVASGTIKDTVKHKNIFRVMAWLGIPFGLFMNSAGVLMSLHPATKDAIELKAGSEIVFFVGQYVLTAGYIGIIVLMCQSKKWLKWINWMAPLGRMALTNYITHSIILTSIFYGYAGGMFSQISRGPQMLIVVAILLCQVLISTWWLNRFNFGPLEWLWRSLTYLKLQAFIKTDNKKIYTQVIQVRKI